MNELIKNFEQWMLYAYIKYNKENPCTIENLLIYPVIEHIYYIWGSKFKTFHFITFVTEKKVLFYFNPEILLKIKILKCCITKEEAGRLCLEFFNKTCDLFKEMSKK